MSSQPSPLHNCQNLWAFATASEQRGLPRASICGQHLRNGNSLPTHVRIKKYLFIVPFTRNFLQLQWNAIYTLNLTHFKCSIFHIFYCAKTFPLINNYSLFMHSSPKIFTTINTLFVYTDLHLWLAHINHKASDLLLLFPIGMKFSRLIHFVVR